MNRKEALQYENQYGSQLASSKTTLNDIQYVAPYQQNKFYSFLQ
jgi:hypothetical protein